MTPEKLQEILAAHKLWLNTDGEQGQRAYLSGANLTGADLTGAVLSGAVLTGAKGIMRIEGAGNRPCYFVQHQTAIMVKTGCFWGDLDTFRQRARDEDKPHYLHIADCAEAVLTQKSYK